MKRLLTRSLAVLPIVWMAYGAAPLRADSRIEETRKLEPGGKFVVDADAGSVEIAGTVKTGAHVLITSDSDDLAEKFDIKIEESPGLVKVTARKKGGKGLSSLFSWNSVHAPKFKVEVPPETTLAVKTGGGHIEVTSIEADASLETSGGHISVEHLRGRLEGSTSGGHIQLNDIAGDAKIETSGGHIKTDDIRGSLQCQTSGGHISLRKVTGDIHCETSGGHIEIDDAGGLVDASTSGGSIEASFARGNAKGGTLETSGGSVTVKLDPSVGLDIDAETSGGSVSSDIPVSVTGPNSRSNLRGSVGKGGATLRIRSSAGSIKIESGAV